MAVTPSRMFNSVLVAVTPSRMFSSAVVEVTPSRMFNSVAVEVIAVEPMVKAVAFTVPTTSRAVSGSVTPIPTLPPERMRICSVAAAVLPVAKIRLVGLAVVVNASSATAQILAPGRIASVPEDSRGALKLILPSSSAATIVSSLVARYCLPAVVVPVPTGP